MKVLIVAKTRRGTRACVGGITSDGQSVRLVAANTETNERAGMEYNVGEVWDVEGAPDPAVVPPHVENIVVYSRRKLALMSDPVPSIERHMPPQAGGLDVLFEGLVQSTQAGALYVAQHSGVPSFSTMFWRPDRPLTLHDTGRVPRYSYPSDEGERTLAFVGFQPPLAEIPAGALLRVSLAHWWRPESDPDAELRCYVQLSGWFLAATAVTPVTGQVSVSPGSPAGTGAASTLPPDLSDAQHLLKRVFGYDTFRPLQREVIANLLARRDTLAIMPTGSGKSLCYQLPALLLPGLTVVVSPLIALMQDQVDQLRELGVSAAFLNSSLDYQEYGAVVDRVRKGEVKLLYTSPETLLAPRTLALLDRCRPDCLAIDEAHCISAWGHDFRPEYRDLLSVRRRYPGAVCVAFTATATPRVQRDIRGSLGFRDENQFIASFNRENLYLEVQPRGDGFAQTLAFLKAHRDQSGIIYCSTRQGVDTLTARLQAARWSVLPYHAGMEDQARRRNQALFNRDKVAVIIATIAFGMGINKPNVRFVLHYNLPQSLESYYQEIGRAGRDGLQADCLLLFSRADLYTIHRFIEDGAEAERPGRHARLQAMLRYAEASTCRRKSLLEYFGEAVGDRACGFCDNCRSSRTPLPQVDVSEEARNFLLCVKMTGQVFGVAHIVDVLRGSRGQGVLRRHHDRLPCYGSGKQHDAAEWKRLAEEFIRQGLLEHDMEHGSLRLAEAGHQVLAGARVSVVAAQPGAPGPVSVPQYDAELFGRLRELRAGLAAAAGVPPYVIFSDRSLVDMVDRLPHSPASFLAIYGVGQRKLEQHGEQFLDVIRAWCQEHHVQEPARSPATATQFSVKRRWMEVGELFAAGRSLTEIQGLYGVKANTVVQNLHQCVQAGQSFEPDRIRELSSLSPEDQERVLAIMKETGCGQLRPIYDALGEAISYDELHVMRLYYLCAANQSHATPDEPAQGFSDR